MRKVINFFRTLAVVFSTIISSILTFIFMLFKRDDLYFKLAGLWSGSLVKSAGIKISMKGTENIQMNKSCIYVSNHSSYMDIPVLINAIKTDLALIYKKELEKIPFFGPGMRRSPHVAIVRLHPKKAMRSIDEALDKLQDGVSILVFPEGTRSETGELQDFKRGAFMLASRSGRPIIPVSVKGTNRSMPKGSMLAGKSDVHIEVHKPITDYKIEKPTDEKELMNRVHEIIKSGLEKKN